MEKEQQLKAALELAIDIIESYEMDMRNSHRKDGGILDICLEESGFCQGRIYKQALSRIRKLAGDAL